MQKSESISKIMPALLKAQSAMGGAKKGASNPFFKSKYADLGAVLEACKDLLNDNGITILQPHGLYASGGAYVQTLLVHESGEYVGSETPVICAKQNDPQALGSAITYARRYGLQSLLSMPAEDDDGESAMDRGAPRQGKKVNDEVKAPVQKRAEASAKATAMGRVPEERSATISPPSSTSEEAPSDRETLNQLITNTGKVLNAKKTLLVAQQREELKKRGAESKEQLTDEQAKEFYIFLKGKLNG